MYSRNVTELALRRAERKLGIRLRRHPLAFVERSVAHLDALMQDDGTLRRPLTPDERAFIRNERLVCKMDYLYWASRYARIKHFSENRLVPYVPNVAQQIMNDIRAEMEEEGIALFIQQLKARQLGATTDTEMCIAHRVQFHTHVEAVVASSRPEKSEEMSNKMVLCWQNQPWWLLPRETASRAGSLIEFGELHSAVSIQHGAQLTGIARGRTPNVVHLSELCEYENPEELVDASLLRAVHHSPSTFFVMESTALGIGNWWHDTWLVSKEGWPSRTSDFRPIFLPWFVGSDIYPDDIWLKAHPIPPNWQPSEVALAHAQRCREFVQRNDLLRRHLGFNWSLPRRQLWWWEVERNISLKKRQLSKFYMETPADDVEAFQNTNPSVFEPETIELLHKDTHSPLAVFGFRGSPDHFPLAIQPDLRQIDPEAPILPVRAQCSQAYRPVHADLVPLKFQGYSGYNEMGKLFVWELPEEGSEYGVGVDTSEGVGQDRSVIQVIRKATLDGRPPAQVAEFASPRLNSLDLFPFVFTVGQFYSTRRRDGGLARPRMVIECRWNGENVQVELQKHGWPNFHKWTRYHKTKYNLAQERNLGWYSNAWSRPMMMDYFIKALRDQMFMAPSPFLVAELSTLEIDEAGQTIKALHGRHDDRVMACGIVYFSLHILETGGIMQPMSAQRTRSKVAPVYSPPYQQMDNQDVSGADIWTPDERLQAEGDE